MSNIIQFRNDQDIATSLRNIADAIDNGEYKADHATIIIGQDIFHAGTINNNDAHVNAVWDMTFGINKLMNKS